MLKDFQLLSSLNQVAINGLLVLAFSISMRRPWCDEHTYHKQIIIPEFQTCVEIQNHCQPLSLITYCIDFRFKYCQSLIIPFT